MRYIYKFEDSDNGLTEEEYRLILLFRKLKPYGEMKVSLNQTGGQASVYITSQIKEVLEITRD